MYLPSKGNSLGKKAQLVSSRQYAVVGFKRCLNFQYHMFGPLRSANTLNVYLDQKLIWTRSTNQGNRWKEGFVTLEGPQKPYEVCRVVIEDSKYPR